MATAEIGLVLSVVATGLWSGLLLMLVTILHPIYAPRAATGFREDMGRLLPVARRSPTNYVLVIAMVLAPVVALVGLWPQPTSAEFVLAVAGLVAVVVGPLLTSSLLAERNYAVILSWDPAGPPDDWQIARARYLRLNWIRAALTWAALALFVTATFLHLTP
jgi:hypothetical protein